MHDNRPLSLLLFDCIFESSLSEECRITLTRTSATSKNLQQHVLNFKAPASRLSSPAIVSQSIRLSLLKPQIIENKIFSIPHEISHDCRHLVGVTIFGGLPFLFFCPIFFVFFLVFFYISRVHFAGFVLALSRQRKANSKLFQ